MVIVASEITFSRLILLGFSFILFLSSINFYDRYGTDIVFPRPIPHIIPVTIPPRTWSAFLSLVGAISLLIGRACMHGAAAPH